MPRLLPALTAALTMLAAPAIAQHTHPDIRGTWKGGAESVSIGAAAADAHATFQTYGVTIEITEQQNRRFAGRFSLEGGDPHPIVGVFTEPGRILWSEPSGFAHGNVIDNDTIEVCFVHSAEFQQIASCERYQRQQ